MLLTAALALPARAQPSGHPATLTSDKGTPLTRIGLATRAHLLGQVEIYTVALYLDGSTTDRARLESEDVAKALRIEIRYEDDERQLVPFDWRRELIPNLNPTATAHLRGLFAPLRPGDVVLVEYVPRKGTILRVNKSVAVSNANHQLMMAFLDHWLGQRPVSEDVKRALLGAS